MRVYTVRSLRDVSIGFHLLHATDYIIIESIHVFFVCLFYVCKYAYINVRIDVFLFYIITRLASIIKKKKCYVRYDVTCRPE